MLDFITQPQVIIAICTALWGWVVWSFNRKFADKKDVEDVDSKVNCLDNRITKAEDTLKTLPKSSDVHELKLALANLGGDVKAISQATSRMERTLDLQQEYLMKNKGS